METLFAGVIIWAMAHLFGSVAPGPRARLTARMGLASRGLVAMFVLAALALIVIGWGSIVPQPVYDPPLWGRHLNMALMFVSVLLIVVARGTSRVRQWVRHPMLTGALIWAVAHLLANGDNRSILLFSGIGLWALVSMFTISRREGLWVKPVAIAGVGGELWSLLIACIAYVALIWGHGYFTGMPLLPNG